MEDKEVCKYCKIEVDEYGKNSGKLIEGSNDRYGMYFIIDDDIYFLKGNAAEIKVTYCPMCGRKLN